jgi:predicted dehydrogenase
VPRLRVLVIGAGFIAKRWVETIAACPGVELVGVASRSHQRGAAIVQDAGLPLVPVHEDWERALSPGVADAVIITLPQQLHPRAVVGALEAGCHVLVEKPLAIDPVAVRAIVEAARRRPEHVVMVNQNFRWRPHVQALRLAVHAGMVGEVGQVMIECRQQIRRTTIDGWRERMAEPYLLDFAIHHFDLLRYVLGDEPATVVGRSFRPSWSWFDGHSAAAAVLEMRRGTEVGYSGTMVSSGFETPQEGVITIVGERGTLRLDQDSVVRMAAGGTTSDIAPVPVPGGEFGFALDEFVSSVRERRAPEVSLEEHIRSLAIAFAIIESGRTGRRVVLGG